MPDSAICRRRKYLAIPSRSASQPPQLRRHPALGRWRFRPCQSTPGIKSAYWTKTSRSCAPKATRPKHRRHEHPLRRHQQPPQRLTAAASGHGKGIREDELKGDDHPLGADAIVTNNHSGTQKPGAATIHGSPVLVFTVKNGMVLIEAPSINQSDNTFRALQSPTPMTKTPEKGIDAEDLMTEPTSQRPK